MTKFRDFGSPSNAEGLEPVEFSIFGETFRCHPGLPGKVMLEIVSMGSEDSSPGSTAKAINDFFKSVLASDDDYKRFDKLCKDPEKLIPVDQIMAIVMWLLETYSERPTQRPEDSAPGQ